MSGFVGYLRSSIGKKTIMGLSGLAWSGFAFTHMLGNMLILVSADAYNKYGHAIVSNPLLPLAEAGLVVFLLMHAFTGIKLAKENHEARPERYVVAASTSKSGSAASKTMIYTGSLVLVFLILHLATFKYGHKYTTTIGGVEMRDLHRLIVEVFHQPGYVAWYLLSLVLLGFHLSHGFQASFQSLGFNHPRYTPVIKKAGLVYALVVAAGFLSQPIYVYLVMR